MQVLSFSAGAVLSGLLCAFIQPSLWVIWAALGIGFVACVAVVISYDVTAFVFKFFTKEVAK